jgi:hypothetical protein
LLKIENHWITITNAQHNMYFLHVYSSTIDIVENWNCQTLCSKKNKGCVAHYRLAIHILKRILRQKKN